MKDNRWYHYSAETTTYCTNTYSINFIYGTIIYIYGTIYSVYNMVRNGTIWNTIFERTRSDICLVVYGAILIYMVPYL